MASEKFFIYLLICFFLRFSFVASQISNIECNDSNNGRHFPSGQNCSTFYTCFNGNFHLQSCPNPFWFDFSSQACVIPEDAECNAGPIDVECNESNQGRHFPTTFNCSSYYTCFNNVFHLQNCPVNFIFVYDRQACMYLPDYDCNMGSTTVTTPSSTTQIIPQECPSSGIAKIPNSFLCNRYFLCFGGVKIEKSCSHGLVFSRSQLRCVRREESDCEININICPPTNDPNNIVFLPNQDDCQKYFICYNGEPHEYDCGRTLHWDPINNWCIKAEESHCEPSTNLPDIREIECPAESLNRLIFVPHPENCQFYFICFDKRSHLMKCARNLLFDHVMGECFFEEFARCFRA